MPTTTPAFPPAVAQRLGVIEQNAQAAMERAHADASFLPKSEQAARLNAIANAKTSPRNARLRALRILADDLGRSLARHAPCRRGCAHCCHIGVAITASEATLLAKASGRTPARNVATNLQPTELLHYRNPCPFLKNGECSVYDARPIACRTHFSADVDSLLCELVEGTQIPVPYFDLTAIRALHILLSAKEVVADVRDFFPPE